MCFTRCGWRAAPWMTEKKMEILFVLVPLSVVLVLLIVAGLWWAVERGQFDDIEQEGERILRGD